MMRLQADESFSPTFNHRHPLRAYALNSPRAQARLVVLALLADGRVDEREVDALHRRNIFGDLGISRSTFIEVLSEFCSDVAGQLPVSEGGYQLTHKALGGMLDEISDRTVRDKLLRHMLALINCDGHLSDVERGLIRNTLEHWQPRRDGGKRMSAARPTIS